MGGAATDLVGGRVRALDSVEGRECRFGAAQRLENPVGHALAGSRAALHARRGTSPARRALGQEPIQRGLLFASLRTPFAATLEIVGSLQFRSPPVGVFTARPVRTGIAVSPDEAREEATLA